VQRAALAIAARLVGRLRRGSRSRRFRLPAPVDDPRRDPPPPGRPPVTSWLGAAVAGGAGLLMGCYVTVLIQRVPAARTVSGSFGELTRRPLGECPHCAAGRPAADPVPPLRMRSSPRPAPDLLAGMPGVVRAGRGRGSRRGRCGRRSGRSG
jgi:hypothetical protein